MWWIGRKPTLRFSHRSGCELFAFGTENDWSILVGRGFGKNKKKRAQMQIALFLQSCQLESCMHENKLRPRLSKLHDPTHIFTNDKHCIGSFVTYKLEAYNSGCDLPLCAQLSPNHTRQHMHQNHMYSDFNTNSCFCTSPDPCYKMSKDLFF